MKNRVIFLASAAAVLAMVTNAEAGRPGRGGISLGKVCDIVSFPFSGCDNPGGTFQSATLLQDMAKDANGNPATLVSLPPQSVPGVGFKVGPVGTLTDPQADSTFTDSYYSWGNAAGHTITATLWISGAPEVGMQIWDDPTGGTNYYSTAPTITAVTPSGTNLWNITTDIALVTHTGFRFYASFHKGCTHTAGTGTNPNVMVCVLSNASAGAVNEFDNYDLRAINGHEATVFRWTGNGPGKAIFKNPKIALDPHRDEFGGVWINSSTTMHNVDLEVDNMEFDGGDESVVPGTCYEDTSCMPYLQQVLAVNWGASGVSGTPEVVVFKNLYAHDTAGNTIGMQTAFTDITFQSPVFINWGMNNGDLNGCTAPNCPTTYHGSAVQFGGSQPGYENAHIHFYNPVFIWPYNFQNGITSCATCVLGGVGTVGTFDDIDFENPTVISNASNNNSGGPQAIDAIMFNVFRVGRVKSFKIHGAYTTNMGVTKCFGVGGDLQAGPTASSVTNGDGKSATVTFTGVSGSPGSAPYPGQWINNISDASHALRFAATTTARNLGDGTSTLNITSTYNGGNSTALAFGQGLGAKLVNPHTTIVSGSGTSYVISDGTGSGNGQTTAAETFVASNYLNAFGTAGTTATAPPPIGNLNGTYKADGFLAAASNALWAAQNGALDTLNTIDLDISGNHEMTTTGDDSETYDDVNGTYGKCPSSNPA